MDQPHYHFLLGGYDLRITYFKDFHEVCQQNGESFIDADLFYLPSRTKQLLYFKLLR